MLIRSIFLALAFMLPTAWTVARAADAPAGEAAGDAKKEKKAKKGKKAEGEDVVDGVGEETATGPEPPQATTNATRTSPKARVKRRSIRTQSKTTRAPR